MSKLGFGEKFNTSVALLPNRGGSRLQSVLMMDWVTCQYARNEISRGGTPDLEKFFLTMERAMMEYELSYPVLNEYLKDLTASTPNGQVYNLPLLLCLSHLSVWTLHGHVSEQNRLLRQYIEFYRPLVWSVLKDLGVTLDDPQFRLSLNTAPEF